MSSTSASAHNPPCSGPVGERCGDQQRGSESRAAGEADRRLAQAGIVAAGEHEQRDVRSPYDRVSTGEQQAGVAEHVGHAERRHEQPRHGGEDREPDDALLGVDDAGQPGIADPAPPQHAEHEQSLREPRPRRRVGHQRGALREREHEDEVEEQLQRRDGLALAQHRGHARRAGGDGGAHPGMISGARRAPAAAQARAGERRARGAAPSRAAAGRAATTRYHQSLASFGSGGRKAIGPPPPELSDVSLDAERSPAFLSVTTGALVRAARGRRLGPGVRSRRRGRAGSRRGLGRGRCSAATVTAERPQRAQPAPLDPRDAGGGDVEPPPDAAPRANRLRADACAERRAPCAGARAAVRGSRRSGAPSCAGDARGDAWSSGRAGRRHHGAHSVTTAVPQLAATASRTPAPAPRTETQFRGPARHRWQAMSRSTDPRCPQPAAARLPYPARSVRFSGTAVTFGSDGGFGSAGGAGCADGFGSAGTCGFGTFGTGRFWSGREARSGPAGSGSGPERSASAQRGRRPAGAVRPRLPCS